MGSREHALAQTSRTQVTSLPQYLIWIDGDLDSQVQTALVKLGLVSYTRCKGYSIGVFSSWQDSQKLSEIIPSQFVLQDNKAATQLKLNFNPTQEQLEKLRDYANRVKTLTLKKP